MRAQVFGHGLAVGFVELIHIVAEGMGAFVKDYGDMCGRIWACVALNIAVEHVAKARDRADGQAIGLARERGQRVIGAEDEGGAVDQMKVAAFAECHARVSPWMPLRFATKRAALKGRSLRLGAICKN